MELAGGGVSEIKQPRQALLMAESWPGLEIERWQCRRVPVMTAISFASCWETILNAAHSQIYDAR
jgi:hypothetical protein